MPTFTLQKKLTVLALALAFVAAGGEQPVAQDVAAGRLTMEVEAEPLADVLAAIARAADIELKVEGELGEAPPQRFDAVPLDIAVRRLAGTHSVVMIHAPGAAGRLREVRVYAIETDPEARREASVRQARQAARASQRETESDVQGDRAERATRVQEVRELARSGGPEAAGELERILQDDPDPAIRRLAIGALSGLDDPSASEAIASALSDEDRAVRVQAVRALRNLLDDGVAPYLAQVIRADDEVAVRMMAVQMAADLSEGAGEEVLRRALDDPDEEVREIASEALGR